MTVHHSGPTRVIAAIVLFLVLGFALGGGCSANEPQRLAAQRFASATRALSAEAERVLLQQRASTIGLSQHIVRVGDPAGLGLSLEDADRALDADDIAARVVALRTLSEYAELLDALARGEDAERIARASADIEAGLRALAGDEADPDPKRTAIAQLVAGLAQGAASAHSYETLREAVTAGAPVVLRVAELLEADFDDAGTGVRAMALLATRDGRVTLGLAQFQAAAGDQLYAFESDLSQAQEWAGPASERVRTAIAACVAAHAELVEVVEAGGPTAPEEIVAYAARVRELVALAEIIAQD